MTADPTFPALHGRPARGWVNDPNGLAHVDGRYHVFFQHNPHGPVHDAIAWGHVSSTDLVTWDEEPVAITPRPGELDAFGCWTGCAVDDGGVPTLVYSAVADRSGRSEVVLAHSDRTLRTWKQGTTGAVGMPDDDAVSDVRDPFVFELEGHRFAVQGAGHRDGGPSLLVYGCDDLSAWEPLGALLEGDHPLAAEIAPANIWECPNLFPLGDRWVLVLSLWRNEPGPTLFALHGVRHLVGDLVLTPDGPRFEPDAGGLLDDGPCFYAPQVLRHDGRSLLWAWSWERGLTEAQTADVGWAGCLTFPRELSLEAGQVVSRPVPELEALRGESVRLTSGDALPGLAVEVLLPTTATRATLVLRTGDSKQVVAEVEVPSAPVQPTRVLLDGSMVEVFDGGATATTTRAYPGEDSAWVLTWDDGESATAYALRLPAAAQAGRPTPA